MQLEKYEELEQRASKPERLDAIKQLEARVRVHQEIEAMQAEGKALVLTDEEMRLLAAFRHFKLSPNSPASMDEEGSYVGKFTWQTRFDRDVVIAPDTFARGFRCADANRHKQMDAVLAEAITQELLKLA